jgi:hypothetical protein
MGFAHTKLVDEARESLDRVYNDRSVHRPDTLESLKALAAEIATMIDFITEELEGDEECVFQKNTLSRERLLQGPSLQTLPREETSQNNL